MANKIDSNVTGLSIAYETDIGVLPVTPVWYPLEPNSYSDFGPNIKTTPREPISQSRQRRKGFVTDLDATAGWNQDLTQDNMTRHMQGFMFAAIREKYTTKPMNANQVPVTAVDASTGYAAAGSTGFAAGNIVKASGFALTANNGIKTVVSSTAPAVIMNAQVTEASPPAAAKLQKVGHQFAASDVAMTLNGGLARMTSTANALGVLGLIPGEWVFVGGDSGPSAFAISRGWARASIVTAGYIEFDKTDWVPTAEAGTGKTAQVFIGSVLRTEEDPALQKRFTGTIERTLGFDANGQQAEYVSGSCANTLAINMPMANKISLDLGYVAIDGSTRTGTQGLMTGTRIPLDSTDAFNTADDFSRIKMSLVDPTSSNVTPLFAYLMDLTINIGNNVTPNKALGKLGAFDTTAGMFTADGKLEAYFSNVTATSAVRNNADVTIDVVIAKQNAGMVFDLPLISLGGGLNKVEKDKPITIPIDAMGAQSKFGHTMIYQNFAYLPNVAS